MRSSDVLEIQRRWSALPAADSGPGPADEHQAVAVVPLAETGLTADASAPEGGGSDDEAMGGGGVT